MLDAHAHVWELTRFAYEWLPRESPIARDFPPDLLAQELQAAGLAGALLVQADNSWAEGPWLCDLAAVHLWARGAVVWADLLQADAAATVGRLAALPACKGVRPALPGPASWPLLHAQIALLGHAQLCCEWLPFPAYLEAYASTSAAYPQIRFVLDHLGGLNPFALTPRQLRTELAPLAQLPNVALKISGWLELAPREGDPLPAMRDTLALLLELFGPKRLMYGSNWPVCTRHVSLAETAFAMRELLAPLSLTERDAIQYRTATEIYRIA